MPPIVRVEISHDGQEVYPSALQPNLKFTYGLFNGGKVTQVGPITFVYGFNRIRRIGNLSVTFDWNGNVKLVSGRDDRVEITVFTRSHTHPSENRAAGKPNRS